TLCERRIEVDGVVDTQPSQGRMIMETMLKDLKFGIRTMMRSPGFTFVALITIALGIGANTAIFSVVNTVLLSPLPYEQPGRLLVLWERQEQIPQESPTHAPCSHQSRP